MANNFRPTASYSNLTRLELEQLRRADFFSGGRALTVGDAAEGSENVVGKGNIQAEPFGTAPTVSLDDIYTLTPPTFPGQKIETGVSVGDRTAEIARWFGPTVRLIRSTGTATAVNQFTIPVGSLSGVQAGDLLLIQAKAQGGTDANRYAVGTVGSVAGSVITLSRVFAPHGSPTNVLTVDGTLYYCTIIRPGAVQLFAVPGSGPVGREQTFLAVRPGSTLHGLAGPTIDQINQDRITDLVPPTFSESLLRDRADALYGAPAPGLSCEDLGYRVVLYPDNGSGAPDLTRPIATLNPVIDPSVPSDDQRFTIDYRAGVIRFSCAPALGGDIKVSGGTNPTTGRLNLYAVFFAFDQSLTQGSARSLYASRSDEVSRPGARVFYDATTDAWHLTANDSGDDFFVRSQDSSTDYRRTVKFGALESSGFSGYFVYDLDSRVWRFRAKPSYPSDSSDSMEMGVGQKTSVVVGDITAPAMAPGDINASGGSPRGARDTSSALDLLRTATTGSYGVVHLRRGKYNLTRTLHVPPGIVIEGEGDSTLIEYNPALDYLPKAGPAIKFGSNNRYGTFDYSYNGVAFDPTTISTLSDHVEGQDIIWNPVRRVWALFWADATSQKVFYQEIDASGQALFSTPLEIKSTTTPLFTVSSSPRPWHTTGHYPRVAFHEATDTYAVAWVETQTLSGEVGPKGVFAIIQTDVDTREDRPSPQAASFTTILGPTEFSPGRFTTHPSVAASSVGTYRYGFSYWTFEIATVGSYKVPTNSSVGSCLISGALSLYPNDTMTPLSGPSMVTSTDVSEDTYGGFLFAWSRHAHPAYFGPEGALRYDREVTETVLTAAWTQPGYPYPAPASPATQLTLSVPTSNQYRAGDVVFLSRPVETGTLTVVDAYTASVPVSWGNVAVGDWLQVSGEWHLVDDVSGTNLTVLGSVFGVTGSQSFTVWSGIHNSALTGHLVSKYVVDTVYTGSTNQLALRILDHLSIDGGTSFPSGGTTILRAPRTYLEDSLVSDWTNLLGTRYPTSKLHRLGRALTIAAQGQNQDHLYGSDLGAYGVGNGTTLPLRLYVRSWPQGWNLDPNGTEYFLVGTPWTPLAGTVTSPTQMTDLATDFVARGVQAGDWVFLGFYGYRIATVTTNTLTITGDVFRTTGAVSYSVVAGAHHEAWCLTAQTFLEGKRFFAAGTLGDLFEVAGTSVDKPTVTSYGTYQGEAAPTALYHRAQYEPDFVRLSRGSDRWVAVYQAFRTTAQLAVPEATNWANKAIIPVGDRSAVYREHVSTCYAVVEDFAGESGVLEALSGPSETDAPLGWARSDLYGEITRDIEVSNRSAGTRAPLVHRPNYIEVQSSPLAVTTPTQRSGHTFNNEIGCINYMHRWTATRMPSLIPDVTWTGEDWTFVSPTKRTIESYTGVYRVDGSSNVTLTDMTFMFGSGSSPTPGTTTFLRKTFNGKVWFPSVSALVTCTVVDEHTVSLGTTNPLGVAPNGEVRNVRWFVAGEGPDQTGVGAKNLGFRVSGGGELLVSSSYHTFAEEPDDNAYTGPTPSDVPRRQETLRRSAGGALLGLYGDGTVFPLPELIFSRQTTDIFRSRGQNASNAEMDGFEEGGRLHTNVGFTGVAPGEPLLSDYRNDTQAPLVALAWGETCYGLSSHVTAPSTGKQLRVYRQSFGPYRNGLRGVRLLNRAQGGTKVLSMEWVHTRHGAPVTGTHRFATDGIRNVWAYPYHRKVLGSFGGPSMGIRYLYTDALGRNPVHMDGPNSIVAPLSGSNWQDPFPSDMERSNATGEPTGWFGVSSPKVVWDGSRYMVAWIEGGAQASTTPVLCLAVAPGSEDGGPQGPELGTPSTSPSPGLLSDLSRLPRVTAAVSLQTDNTSLSTLAVMDVAFSGQTYAVLWVAGLDTRLQNPMTAPLQRGAVIGVTIFDQLGAAQGLDFDAQTVTSGRGSCLSSQDRMSFEIIPTTGGMSPFNALVAEGDIVVFTKNDPNTPDSLLVGTYVVRDLTGTSIVVDRSLPTFDNVPFVVKRPTRPAGAKTYVLGSAQMGVWGPNRWKPYRSPRIVWDGKTFVAFWLGDPGTAGVGLDFTAYNNTRPSETFYSLAIPEHGLATGTQTKLVSTEANPYSEPTACLGIVELNASSPSYIHFGCTLDQRDSDGGTVGVQAVGTNQVVRASGQFSDQGVRPGDFLFVSQQAPGTPSLNARYEGVFVIAAVAGAVLTVQNPSGSFTFTNRAFFILKGASDVRVRVGDTMRIDGLVYNRTSFVGGVSYYAQGSGSHVISDLDTFNRRLKVSSSGTQPFAGTSNYEFGYLPVVYGEIVSGTVSDGNYQPISPNQYLGGPTPNPRGLVVPGNAYVPRDILGFVHNEKTTEYAVLWAGQDATSYGLHVSFFSEAFERHIVTHRLNASLLSASTRPFVGDITWNGHEYLVVYDLGGTAVYRTIRGHLLGPATEIGTTSRFLYGSGSLISDGRYDQFDETKDVVPVFTGLQSRWNDRLGRWVLSVSVGWLYVLSGGRDPGGTDSFPAFLDLPNTVMTGYGLDGEVLLNSTADWDRLQPGMRVMALDGQGREVTALVERVQGPPTNQIRLSTLNFRGFGFYALNYLGVNATWTGGITGTLTDPDPFGRFTDYYPGDRVLINNVPGTITLKVTNQQVQVELASGVVAGTYTYIVSKALNVVPREDVFCLTLGTESPSVAFEDADGSYVENSTITGAVEERYSHMGRPVWQSGGMAVGNWSISERVRPLSSQGVGDGVFHTHKPAGYNHRFLTPRGKIRLPKRPSGGRGGEQ